MKVDLYTHRDKEQNREAGQRLKLSDKAMELFLFVGYEHEMTYEVVSETGQATLVAVDGQKLETT